MKSLSILTALSAFIFYPSAKATNLFPGTEVIFNFTVDATHHCEDAQSNVQPCDTLEFFPFQGSPQIGSPTFVAQLFDGTTLLGTYTGSPFVSIFKSPTSALTFANPTVADFTTILNGTINGVLKYELLTGELANVDLTVP